MSKRYIWMLVLLAVLLGGCKSQTEEKTESSHIDMEILEAEEADQEIPEAKVGYEIERTGIEAYAEAEDGTVLFSGVIYYPAVQIADAPEVAEKINTVFEATRERDSSTIEEYKTWAEEHYQGMLEQEQMVSYFGSYALDRDFEVVHPGEKLLSIRQEEYVYLGGAHPSSTVMTYNFDMTTGEALHRLDLFSDEPEFLAYLKEQVLTYLEEQQLGDGMTLIDGLYPDHASIIEESLQAPTWYVKEGSLWIVFNEYEIAPYAAGIIEAEIPLAELEEHLNATGRELLKVAEDQKVK